MATIDDVTKEIENQLSMKGVNGVHVMVGPCEYYVRRSKDMAHGVQLEYPDIPCRILAKDEEARRDIEELKKEVNELQGLVHCQVAGIGKMWDRLNALGQSEMIYDVTIPKHVTENIEQDFEAKRWRDACRKLAGGVSLHVANRELWPVFDALRKDGDLETFELEVEKAVADHLKILMKEGE